MSAEVTLSELQEAARALQTGAAARAQGLCEAILARHPGHGEASYILGGALMQQGDCKGAERALEQAHAAARDNVAVLASLGGAYSANGKREEALVVLQRAVQLDPNYPWAQQNLGLALRGAGEVEAARRCFERALSINPAFAPAYAGLAEIAMQQDREHEALGYAAKALEIAPHLASARIVVADSALQRRKYDVVLEQLNLIRGLGAAPPERQVSCHFLAAQAYENTKRYDEAFESYARANEILRRLHQEKFEGAPGISAFATIAALSKLAAHADVASWRRAPVTGPTPVFFVGYPRSGTTLLDQVLASHPDIESLEENQNFVEAYRALIEPDGALGRWSALTDAEIQEFRAAYWRRAVAAYGSEPAKRVFVDKMPLNTVLLPLIYRLFPDAKIIFALRDPRDVVLSCFTQRFRMNPAMYHFLSIETAARHYDAVMTLAKSVRERFPLQIHLTRYEDLITDFDRTVGALLAFLDLPWDDRVRDYAATAKARDIHTPSAPDVRLPLYASSMARWRKYATQAAGAFALLAPWVREYGYDQA